jgi:hypothetical protein
MARKQDVVPGATISRWIKLFHQWQCEITEHYLSCMRVSKDIRRPKVKMMAHRGDERRSRERSDTVLRHWTTGAGLSRERKLYFAIQMILDVYTSVEDSKSEKRSTMANRC